MDTIFAKTTERMEKCLDSLDRDFSTIRAGRANPNVLNNVMVDYYGTPTPLQQVGNISVPEARILQIQPWESSLIKEIEKNYKDETKEEIIERNENSGRGGQEMEEIPIDIQNENNNTH